MQKFTLLLCSASAILALGIGLSSCKDDEPFVKPNLSVASKTVTFSEAAGTIEVAVVLDKGAPADITIEYDLGGTALSPADYSIVGKEGEVEIAKGETSGTISIQLVSDVVYEGDETIEISLEDVDSDDVVITNDDETIVTITDDDPQIQASFKTTTLTVVESDNEDFLEIEVVLDNPAAQEVTVKFEITHGEGHAIDALYGIEEEISSQYYDYYVEGDEQSVVIAQGSQTGKIQLQLLSDFVLEDDETIELTLSEASNGVQIATTNKIMTITLQQEDGRIVALVWKDEYADVDMDLILWAGDDASNLDFAAISAYEDVDPKYELLFIPAAIQDAAFGLSYVYYSGTVTPMDFEAQFIDFANGAAEAQANFDVYSGSYTLANINAWETLEDLVHVEQTFQKDAGAYVNVSTISVPASGSRAKFYKVPSGLKKMNHRGFTRSGSFKLSY
jgi:hypothetical protein